MLQIKKKEDYWMAEGCIIMTKLILCEIEQRRKKKKEICYKKHFEKGFGESLMTWMVPKDRTLHWCGVHFITKDVSISPLFF